MIGAALFWAGAAIVLGSYVGYGLWVAWRARRAPVPVRTEYREDARLPAVTCVVTARDEASAVARKLRVLDGQDYPREKLAIVVVSDASTDGTDEVVAERAARDDRVRLLRTPGRAGKPTALNLARPAIRTEVAVFMDARQDLTPTAIRELVAHLADPAVGIVSGDLRVRGDAYWTYEGLLRKNESRSGSMVQVTGSLYAIRTSDFPVIPPSTILDDVYVPLTVARSGRRIVMAEAAGSLDVVTRRLGNEFVRKVRTLAGLVQVCGQVEGCLHPRRNPVWGRLVCHKLSRLLCPYGLLMMLAGAWMAPGWFYATALGLAVLMAALAAAACVGIRPRPAALSQSFLALNLAALWAVPAYCLGRASVTWTRVETDRA
jgi:hypothetical protein